MMDPLLLLLLKFQMLEGRWTGEDKGGEYAHENPRCRHGLSYGCGTPLVGIDGGSGWKVEGGSGGGGGKDRKRRESGKALKHIWLSGITAMTPCPAPYYYS